MTPMCFRDLLSREGSLAEELYSFEGSPDLADGTALPTSTSKDSHCDEPYENAPWYDSDEDAGGPSGQDKEWQKRSEHLYNSGYRGGITAEQNASVQEGFNQGFKDSVLVGYRWCLVRGVTKALEFLPEQLKAQMVGTEEMRSKLQCLGETVSSVSSEDALKLFHEDVQIKKSGTQRKESRELSSKDSYCTSLDSYFQKLMLFLEKSPAIKLHPGTNEKIGV